MHRVYVEIVKSSVVHYNAVDITPEARVLHFTIAIDVSAS